MVKGSFFYLDMREISEQREKQVDKTGPAEWIWPGLLVKEGKLAGYRE